MEDECPECMSDEIETSSRDGDTYFHCKCCGYTVENGVETQESNYTKLVELMKKRDKIEEEILGNLPDKDECRCDDDVESITCIHYGNFLEIMNYCLRCGGMKEIREDW